MTPNQQYETGCEVGKRIELPDECIGLVIDFAVLEGDQDYPFDNDRFPVKYDIRYERMDEWLKVSPWAKTAVYDWRGYGQIEGSDGIELFIDPDKIPANLTVKAAVAILKKVWSEPLDLSPFEEEQKQYLRDYGEDDSVARPLSSSSVPTYGRCLCGKLPLDEKGPPHHVKAEELEDHFGNNWKCKKCDGWFEAYPLPKKGKK